jgi:hypothetical protein
MISRLGTAGWVIYLTFATAGCSAPQRSIRPLSRDQERKPIQVTMASHSALLFDRIPGRPDAEDFNYRSDWPSSGTRQRAAETTYYTIYFDDEQGPGFFGQNFVYRSARYSQFGMEQR